MGLRYGIIQVAPPVRQFIINAPRVGGVTRHVRCDNTTAHGSEYIHWTENK